MSQEITPGTPFEYKVNIRRVGEAEPFQSEKFVRQEDAASWIASQPNDFIYEIEDIRREAVKIKRARLYPSFYEYLDGVVKGDAAQVQSYVDKCLAVKNGNPFPE